jgi:hypothetical protein
MRFSAITMRTLRTYGLVSDPTSLSRWDTVLFFCIRSSAISISTHSCAAAAPPGRGASTPAAGAAMLDFFRLLHDPAPTASRS